MDPFHPIQLLVVEILCVVVGAPLVGVLVGSRGRRSGTWAIARPVVGSAGVLIATFSLAAIVGRAPIDAPMLARSQAVLFAAAVALGALGIACVSIIREPLDAAAFAIGIALAASGGLFVSGPALEQAPREILDVALLANPIVTTTAAAGIDIFRTALLYQVSPLAHTQFDYPAAGTACVSYVLFALVLIVATARQRSRMAAVFSLERMSA